MAMAVTKYAGNLECPDSRFAIDSPACDGVETLLEEFLWLKLMTLTKGRLTGAPCAAFKQSLTQSQAVDLMRYV
jgi:hypothetical protein